MAITESEFYHEALLLKGSNLPSYCALPVKNFFKDYIIEPRVLKAVKTNFPQTAFTIIRDSVEPSLPLLISTNAESCQNSRLYPKTCEISNDTGLVAFMAGSKNGKRRAKMSINHQRLRLPKRGSSRFALTSSSRVQCVV